MSEPTEQKPKKRGRPSSFTQEQADDLCRWMAEGKSLRSWCEEPNNPSRMTVSRWLLDPDRESFRDQYAKAREEQADVMFEELLEIADDGRNDWMERYGRDGESYTVENREAINRSRLRVDTRKWILARMTPRKYGERTAVDVGGQADNPLNLADLVKKAQG